MPCRSTHNHWRAIMPCALFVAFAMGSSSSNAAPAGSRDSGIVPQARQQIRIAASVRPTMTVRRHNSGVAHQGALCIWSNTPTRQYDVRAELTRPGSEPVQLRWNEKTAATIVGNRPAWIRDQTATADSPDCLSSKAVLATLNPGDKVATGILTLVITPQ
jgi:hypothetical protein